MAKCGYRTYLYSSKLMRDMSRTVAYKVIVYISHFHISANMNVCLYCDKSFKNSRSLASHKYTYHSQEETMTSKSSYGDRKRVCGSEREDNNGQIINFKYTKLEDLVKNLKSEIRQDFSYLERKTHDRIRELEYRFTHDVPLLTDRVSPSRNHGDSYKLKYESSDDIDDYQSENEDTEQSDDELSEDEDCDEDSEKYNEEINKTSSEDESF